MCQLNRRSGRPLVTSGIDQLGPWWVIPKGIRHLIPTTWARKSVSSRGSKELSLGHVAGEIFGDAGLSLFVASIKFGDDGASLLVSRNIWWCCRVIFRGRGNIL